MKKLVLQYKIKHVFYTQSVHLKLISKIKQDFKHNGKKRHMKQ